MRPGAGFAARRAGAALTSPLSIWAKKKELGE